MEKVTIIETKYFKYSLTSESIHYLYSWTNLFLLKQNTNVDKRKQIILKGQALADFQYFLKKSLIKLLEVGYTQPALKQLQKHPTRYEKIKMDNKIYTINYSMSVFGHIVFTLYCIFSDIEKSLVNGLPVILYFDNES